MVSSSKSLAVSDSIPVTLNTSAVDTDMLLGFAIHQLQKVGTRVPDDVKSRLEAWVGDQLDSGTQSLHFFMAFFEHWRAGQYTMALESLHRYFDYSLASRSGTDNMRVYYQYALLHLSVLHSDFECWDESIDAMNECIATARENQDAACLNFALSWLLYLRHAHPDKNHSSYSTVSGVVGSNAGERDEVQFLKTKAREGRHWMLLSSTLLEEARLEMFSDGSLGRAHEHIVQAMYLNIQHDLRSLAPAAVIFQSSSLDRLGQSHLANRGYELATTVHMAHCPLNDKVRSACRRAYTQSQAGLFSKAISVLESIASEVSGVLKLDQKVKAYAAIVQSRRRMHHGDNDAADYYIGQLRPLRTTSDPEIVFEVNILEIELLIKQKQLERALSKTNARLAEFKGRGTVDIAQRLHLLILKSRIFGHGGQASKGFAIALRATSAAERHLIIPVFLEGLGVLGRILIDLSEFAMAKNVLESALPRLSAKLKRAN
ncbi:uncharacterized protein RCC_01027 [Ramularia collo-cygni]|uniref:Anaphase-promoting complex subunit 5 n=1 Tax=Ramularia collo-cygni TaxID=112498 RepID=A0A2D3UPZ9_9PEZI|nr:uncharacterized protein RCC_01027 [Ramularia collo-cygni]CZT15135.1 uncharacterized protein RCC_01027 [Ramularia collo-cygni]